MVQAALTAYLASSVGRDGLIGLDEVARIRRMIRSEMALARTRMAGKLVGPIPRITELGEQVMRKALQDRLGPSEYTKATAGTSTVSDAVALRESTTGLRGEPLASRVGRIFDNAEASLMGAISVQALMSNAPEKMLDEVERVVTGQRVGSRPPPAANLPLNLRRAVRDTYVAALTDSQNEFAKRSNAVPYYIWRLGDIGNHCTICLGRDGQRYPSDSPIVQNLPVHPHCACFLQPDFGD